MTEEHVHRPRSRPCSLTPSCSLWSYSSNVSAVVPISVPQEHFLPTSWSSYELPTGSYV